MEEARAALKAQELERERALREVDEEEAREAQGLKPLTKDEKAAAEEEKRKNAPPPPARDILGIERVLPKREPLLSWLDIGLKVRGTDEGENRRVTDRKDEPPSAAEEALMERRRGFHFVTLKLLADPADLLGEP